MIDQHAPQIVAANGDASSDIIEPCSAKASSHDPNDRGTVERTGAENHLSHAPLDRDQTVPETVSSAGHVSGLELTKGRSKAKTNNLATTHSTHHVSGTISQKPTLSQRSNQSSRPKCHTDVSHTMGRASGLTVWESVTKTVPKCRTADQRS